MVTLKSLSKLVMLLLTLIVGMQFVYSAVNVVDVQLIESVYQTVSYNPLKTGSGVWYDENENQTEYRIQGKIIVKNNHATDSVQDVVINISPLTEVSDLTFDVGSTGYVTTSGDFALLVIPDLAAGSTSNFTYTVDNTSISPPLNMTSNYSDTKVFSGLPISVTDRLQNDMSNTVYSNTCIHDIVFNQTTLSITQGSEVLNFTYDNTSLNGDDSNNASFSNLNTTLTWDVWGDVCFMATNNTDISYSVKTPAGVSSATYYSFLNSTLSYRINTSISNLSVKNIAAITDLELNFEKYMDSLLTGDNATWKITAEAFSESSITVNLTAVTLWVSQRNGTGTGFTNPRLLDNDTINTGSELYKAYNPYQLVNSTTSTWNNTNSEWYFNYTFSSSPIVWMDLNGTIYNDGVQLTNKTITYGSNQIYIKEVYIATGYWLQVTKNITRLAEGNYSVFVQVTNLGTSPTPRDQVVVVYNFLPIFFNLSSTFLYSNSTWYNTSETNESLDDAIYNGTMYQYALLPNGNEHNSSLDRYGGVTNLNNTWSVTYNVTGIGEFNFNDLFITGVDPLNVEKYGATKALSIENAYSILSAKGEYFLMGIAMVIGVMLLVF